jgi:hypothetical protein
MANLKLATALRNNRLDEITSYVGTSGILKIFSGTQPAFAGAETTVLAQLTTDATAFAAAASGGVLTLNGITADSNADATGNASWWRVYQSNGTTACIDGDVSATGGGGDMELDSVAIVLGGTVSLGGPNLITEGNA